MNKKKEGVNFVKWFSELDKSSGKFAGGKGANLAEIYNLKIPVPPGFVVTAQAYDYFLEKAGLKNKINELLSSIDYEDTKQLEETTKKIREIITNSKIPNEMKEEILESYESLDARDLDIAKGSALDILKNSSEPVFVAVRSSATAEDLADASFAGQQDSFLNIKGENDLIKHIKKCFASLFTARATYYRNKKGFKHEEVSLAVVVQRMVDSDKSGVIFSKDPSHKNNDIIIEAVWGLGEGIVSGRITPDKYVISQKLEIKDKQIADKKIAITRSSSGEQTIIKLREEKSNSQVLKEYEIKKLSEIALRLEEHYQKPQDIEFAIEGEEIYIVQTRPITTIEGRTDELRELQGEVILTGLAASPGIASGRIKIIYDLKDLNKIKQGDVLVTKMTNPDMVVTMQKSAAIVTDDGGMTAHASIVSREMGIPAIVGTKEATTKLIDGEIITVNGSTGKIYKGKISENQQKQVLPVTATTKTKIKVIVDLPSFAERAAQSKIKSVGLTRIEGIIAESGKHPNYFLEQNRIKDYEEIIFKGINSIAEYFEEIWVRTSDIRSDEFSNLEGAPKEKEANPMLGMHGIRFGLKNPEILKSELKALKRVSEKGKKIGLLLPQVILLEELQKVKEILKEIDFNDAKTGIMIETPAAVQLIKDFCEEGIDFISFGTNDLTQYMLAVDRGNEQVQHLYNEMHPAILYQLDYVIRVCKKYNVESSICGQSGSNKSMVKFLVEKGINSISVNADAAKEISEYIAEIEKDALRKKGEEPRQYHLKKEEAEQGAFVKPQNFAPEEKKGFVEDAIETSEKIIEKGKEFVGNLVSNEKKLEGDNKPDKEFPKIRGVEKIQKNPNDEQDIEKVKEEIEQVEEEDMKKIEDDEKPEFKTQEEIDGIEEDKKTQSDEDKEKEENIILDIF